MFLPHSVCVPIYISGKYLMKQMKFEHMMVKVNTLKINIPSKVWVNIWVYEQEGRKSI